MKKAVCKVKYRKINVECITEYTQIKKYILLLSDITSLIDCILKHLILNETSEKLLLWCGAEWII